MIMRLNLNDNIKVKLTEHGKNIYCRRQKELGKPSYQEIDEDGYTTFQLWCFMELYGIHMGMTLPNVIEPLDIVFDAPTIEPEHKKGEWIEDGYNHYKAVCSECGEPCGTYVMGKPRDRFCKWCGADMREEGEKDADAVT